MVTVIHKDVTFNDYNIIMKFGIPNQAILFCVTKFIYKHDCPSNVTRIRNRSTTICLQLTPSITLNDIKPLNRW